MTEVCRGIPQQEDDDSPSKCRERRRRRIEMRRLAVVSAASTSSSLLNKKGSTVESKRIRTEETSSSASSSGEDMTEATAAEPVFGTMSVAGRSRHMEDALAVRVGLCPLEISNLRRLVHFFAVYDGHGGSHVAALCKEKMHVFLEEELVRVGVGSESGAASASTSGSREQQRAREEEGWGGEEDRWRRVMKRSFERIDEVALSTCACGSAAHQCGCLSMEVALGGSTAVVAVLTPDHIVVANCGDSRAVLCRGGRAIPLSTDHKPDRPDELARIEAAGGRVIYLNGARVEGILAMSRAIGDKYLKPVVISEPEVTFTKREDDDECLILASDGLWDVVSSDLACEVACGCLHEGNTNANAPAVGGIDLNARPGVEEEAAGALYPSRSALAAALLTRLALGRKSSDNISVIVVDLKKS